MEYTPKPPGKLGVGQAVSSDVPKQQLCQCIQHVLEAANGLTTFVWNG